MGTTYASASASTLGHYVETQISLRIQRLAYALRDARLVMNEEAVHQLRVALRRLMEGIRVSRTLLPKAGVKETLRELRRIMRAAGRVRSCDIAAGLLTRAEPGATPALTDVLARLEFERSLAAQVLRREIQRVYKQDSTSKWRRVLELR